MAKTRVGQQGQGRCALQRWGSAERGSLAYLAPAHTLSSSSARLANPGARPAADQRVAHLTARLVRFRHSLQGLGTRPPDQGIAEPHLAHDCLREPLGSRPGGTRRSTRALAACCCRRSFDGDRGSGGRACRSLFGIRWAAAKEAVARASAPPPLPAAPTKTPSLWPVVFRQRASWWAASLPSKSSLPEAVGKRLQYATSTQCIRPAHCRVAIPSRRAAPTALAPHLRRRHSTVEIQHVGAVPSIVSHPAEAVARTRANIAVFRNVWRRCSTLNGRHGVRVLARGAYAQIFFQHSPHGRFSHAQSKVDLCGHRLQSVGC